MLNLYFRVLYLFFLHKEEIALSEAYEGAHCLSLNELPISEG